LLGDIIDTASVPGEDLFMRAAAMPAGLTRRRRGLRSAKPEADGRVVASMATMAKVTKAWRRFMVMFLLLLLLGLWRMMMMMMFQFVGGFCFLRRRGWCIGVGVRESAQKKSKFWKFWQFVCCGRAAYSGVLNSFVSI
jgi:hypothetical protein